MDDFLSHAVLDFSPRQRTPHCFLEAGQKVRAEHAECRSTPRRISREGSAPPGSSTARAPSDAIASATMHRERGELARGDFSPAPIAQ